MSRQRRRRRCPLHRQHHTCTFCGAHRNAPRQLENRWIWRRRAAHDSCAWRAECCILRLPDGQDWPNFENQNSIKEWGTSGSHRTVMPVEQMTTTLKSRDREVTNRGGRGRHGHNNRETHRPRFLRQEAGTAVERQADSTDMPSRTEAQAKSKLLTWSSETTRRRNCPKWRGPSDKPWLHRCNTPLSIRIGSYVKLVDAAALQTNTRCRSTKNGRDHKTKKITCVQPKIVPQEHVRMHKLQVNHGDRASRSTTHPINPSGSTGPTIHTMNPSGSTGPF